MLRGRTRRSETGSSKGIPKLWAKWLRKKKSPFIDLFHPLRTLMSENYRAPLTINGIHLTDEGYRVATEIIAAQLGIGDPLPEKVETLRELVAEKNRQFFLRWRPVNAEYVYGRRKEPFGVLSFPPEMEQLEKQIAEIEVKIHETAGSLAARATKKK